MTNLQNFKNDIADVSQRYTKFMVSRVFENPLDNLLEIEEPTEMQDEMNVEVHLYSLADNQLIFSDTIPHTDVGAFHLRTLQYEGDTVRRLLLIDFSNTNVYFPAGQYEAVFNFFVNEIGTQNSPLLFVSDISLSRTELELKLRPEKLTNENAVSITKFSSPQINSTWVIDALGQVFNQPLAVASVIPSDNTALTYSEVFSRLPEATQDILSDTHIPAGYIENSTQGILDIAYGFATQSIQLLGNKRYTLDTLTDIVSSSLERSIELYTQRNWYTLA